MTRLSVPITSLSVYFSVMSDKGTQQSIESDKIKPSIIAHFRLVFSAQSFPELSTRALFPGFTKVR